MAYFSIVEQHIDGRWWYHPRLTYNSKDEAREGFKKVFWWDLERPYKIVEHTIPFPQKTLYSGDCVNWFDNYTEERFELQ